MVRAQANYAWMNFPQLTEIAGPSAGDFAFAAWAKVPAQNPTWDSNTIIADWGNAPANTHRFTYWFSLANVDANVELRPRAQIRAANAPPDPATVDIIATTLTAAQRHCRRPYDIRRRCVASFRLVVEQDRRTNEFLHRRRAASHANEHVKPAPN